MKRDEFLYLQIKFKVREMTKTITINLRGITHIIECWDDMQSLYKTQNYYEFAKKAQEFTKMITNYDDYILGDLNAAVKELMKLTNSVVKKKRVEKVTIRRIKRIVDYVVNIWCSHYLIEDFHR